MRRLFFVLPVFGIASGCATTEGYLSDKVGVPEVRTFKYCPQSDDSVTDGIMLGTISNSIEEASGYGPLKGVKTGVDVYRIKGLDVEHDQQSNLVFTYIHRQSIGIDASTRTGTQTTFSGKAKYKIDKKNDCSMITVHSPNEFEIRRMKTILFEEIELIGEPQELAIDSKKALKKADGAIEVIKNYRAEGNIFIDKAPEDLSTLVRIKEKISVKSDGRTLYFNKHLNLHESLSFNNEIRSDGDVEFNILPLNGGSIVEYKAGYKYVNVYKSDGSSNFLKYGDLKRIDSAIENYIKSIPKS